MKTIFQYLFLALMSIGIYSSSYAQDYLITLKGDTIWGKMEELSSIKVKFRQSNTAQSIIYSSDEIIKIFNDEKKEIFKSIKWEYKEGAKLFEYSPDEWLNSKMAKNEFQQCVVDGVIEIFHIRDRKWKFLTAFTNTGSGTGFGYAHSDYIFGRKLHSKTFVELNNKVLFKKQKEKRKEKLLKLIGDDEALTDELLKDNKYDIETIIDYTTRYNIKNEYKLHLSSPFKINKVSNP
ncbi:MULTISPECIES: hypothetical protein [unclassified Sphingobacterium]|uniref:hypothetical protein n=1 Tax=unclassified Sphingobacterium TaxID=2609468 RepID=UPI0025EA75E2|nr:MULTISPECIES: hypothetical protein [unclassified Sphingobacterium]